MSIITPTSMRILSFAGLTTVVFLSGCMNPGMYYGNPYGQPMYAPPQMINQGVGGAPGTLYIPESSAPAYDPSKTYQTDPGDPSDDFNKSDGDGRFFGADDDEGVPFPSDGRADDLGVQFSPSLESGFGGGVSRPSSIQPVSATSAPMEYGFDTDNYRWLRGVLRHDAATQSWFVTYSLAAKDRFAGELFLAVDPTQLSGFQDGDLVDIHGRIDTQLSDRQGRPLYRVETMQRIAR